MRMIANGTSTLRSLSDIDRSIAANDGHIYGDGVIAWRMPKKPIHLIRPAQAVISPPHPESAKTDSSPKDAPCPKQNRRSERTPETTCAESKRRNHVESAYLQDAKKFIQQGRSE